MDSVSVRAVDGFLMQIDSGFCPFGPYVWVIVDAELVPNSGAFASFVQTIAVEKIALMFGLFVVGFDFLEVVLQVELFVLFAQMGDDVESVAGFASPGVVETALASQHAGELVLGAIADVAVLDFEPAVGLFSTLSGGGPAPSSEPRSVVFGLVSVPLAASYSSLMGPLLTATRRVD